MITRPPLLPWYPNRRDVLAEIGSRHWVLYLGLCIVSWVVLVRSRGQGWQAIAESLWTEDALIFINHSFQLGLDSLWTPYNGSLQTYQWLVAVWIPLLPLSALPHYFFLLSCFA